MNSELAQALDPIARVLRGNKNYDVDLTSIVAMAVLGDRRIAAYFGTMAGEQTELNTTGDESAEALHERWKRIKRRTLISAR